MKCAYCGASTNTPFIGKRNDGIKESFCDVLCGRLYDTQITPIEPLMKEYNKLYIRNHLTTAARFTFEQFSDYAVFKMIPVCDAKGTPEETKRYYNHMFGV